MVENVALEQGFLEYFLFSLSVSFHRKPHKQYCIGK